MRLSAGTSFIQYLAFHISLEVIEYQILTKEIKKVPVLAQKCVSLETKTFCPKYSTPHLLLCSRVNLGIYSVQAGG